MEIIDNKLCRVDNKDIVNGTVIIPSNVTSIGAFAFQHCYNLTSIVIPEGVTVIACGAFDRCRKLTNIVIPDSVMRIDNHPFDDCDKLVYNEYDNAYYLGNETNPYVVLMKAKNRLITNCEIHPNTKVIYQGAFYTCNGLASITIPDRVTCISSSAFCGCTGLESVKIGNNVTSIGGWAFSGCSGLTSIVIPDSVTSIGSYAFNNCSGLTSITIPDSVESIGYCAFTACNNLISVTIPDNIKAIDAATFEGCFKLRNLTIPKNLKFIGTEAFGGCDNLKTKNGIYKAFVLNDKGKNELRCKDKLYTVNKWHTVKGDLELCRNGIHYCTNLFEIFNYYSGYIDSAIVIYECEVRGEDLKAEFTDKHCTRWLKPVRRLSREEIIELLNEPVQIENND